jgi:hypothetical protein
MMRRTASLLAVLAACAAVPCAAEKRAAPASPAVVYFTKDVSGQGVLKAYGKVKSGVTAPVAVKVHFGEKGNTNYLRPEWVRPLVEQLKATLVETNVLYSGPRQRTETHIALAKEHGFGFAPIDILDSEGDTTYACSTAHYTRVYAGSHTGRYGSYVVLTHFKGHGLAGFGGAIKNVAMGLASRMGKRAMHADYVPDYDTAACVRCGICVRQCPAGAISLDPLRIDTRKCIGCGQCLKACPAGAFEASRDRVGSELFDQRLVEYAKVLADGNRFVYVSVLANISPDCDCAGRARKPFVRDIGVLASTDIVALDQASLDLVNKAHGSTDAFEKESGVSGDGQLEYAERLGMGSRRYALVDLDGGK